jgi:hypothetical protein
VETKKKENNIKSEVSKIGLREVNIKVENWTYVKRN